MKRRGDTMTDQDLRQLYVDELKDLYSAENQLVKALPKMAKAASSDELRQAFEEHLEQTKGQVERLETIFQALDENPYRSTGRPYVLLGALAERRFGRLGLFLNSENLLDVRQTRDDPLVLPTLHTVGIGIRCARSP